VNFVLRDYDGSAPNLSECCVPFLPSVDIERGFRRKSGAGDAGGGFFRVKSLGMPRIESLRSRDFFFDSLHEYYNIGIL
jgi:hypothetical protein